MPVAGRGSLLGGGDDAHGVISAAPSAMICPRPRPLSTDPATGPGSPSQPSKSVKIPRFPARFAIVPELIVSSPSSSDTGRLVRLRSSAPLGGQQLRTRRPVRSSSSGRRRIPVRPASAVPRCGRRRSFVGVRHGVPTVRGGGARVAAGFVLRGGGFFPERGHVHVVGRAALGDLAVRARSRCQREYTRQCTHGGFPPPKSEPRSRQGREPGRPLRGCRSGRRRRDGAEACVQQWGLT